MNITFIVPAIGKKQGEKYIGTWKMEPLMISTLKTLTPKEISTSLMDDRIELIDYDVETDAVMITVETYTAKRAYAIAARFRSRGVPVILGGYHVTLLPEEGGEYGDSIVVGNAETIWLELLADLKSGSLKPEYRGAPCYAHGTADKSIFLGKKYLPVSLVETGRGCVHNCEFCAIMSYYDHSYHKRNIDDIVRDIKESAHKYFFLVDDNLMADHTNAKALFRAITPLKIKWAGQGTISMARDPEMLSLMKKSGCELILIGFESVNHDNLLQMGKKVNLAHEERDLYVDRIHKAGIGIYATFVFGYDNDDEITIRQTLDFAKKHRFYTAAFNHLLPFPGTPLYDRLKEEGRMIYDKWWLDDGYSYGDLAFNPKIVTAGELSLLCYEARREFSAPWQVLRRGFASMGRSSPLMWSLFWAMNLRLGPEVKDKMQVPLGGNLDELPK